MLEIDDRAREMILEYRRATGPSERRADRVLHAVERTRPGSSVRYALTLGAIAAALVMVVAALISSRDARVGRPPSGSTTQSVDEASSKDPLPASVPTEKNANDDASRGTPEIEAPATRPPRAQRSAAPPTMTHVDDSPGGSLGAETRLLDAVDRDIRRGRLAAARAGLQEYARRFPEGVLGGEARGLGHVLSCVMDEPEATMQADRWVRENGTLGLARRVREVCRLDERGAQ